MFDRDVFVSSPEDTILSKLLWYRASPVLERQVQDAVEVYETPCSRSERGGCNFQQVQDAVEVYETQYPDLDEAYLDCWAEHLGVSELLARVRNEAILQDEE